MFLMEVLGKNLFPCLNFQLLEATCISWLLAPSSIFKASNGESSLLHAAFISLKNESVSHSVVSNSCDPMDCRMPGSSLHGILQIRVPEWVAMPFSRGSSQPRD